MSDQIDRDIRSQVDDFVLGVSRTGHYRSTEGEAVARLNELVTLLDDAAELVTARIRALYAGAKVASS